VRTPGDTVFYDGKFCRACADVQKKYGASLKREKRPSGAEYFALKKPDIKRVTRRYRLVSRDNVVVNGDD